jgi:hypothetical protein
MILYRNFTVAPVADNAGYLVTIRGGSPFYCGRSAWALRLPTHPAPFITEIVYDSMAAVGFAGVDADEEVLMRRDRERRRRGRQSRQNARRRRANKIASKAKKTLKANGK